MKFSEYPITGPKRPLDATATLMQAPGVTLLQSEGVTITVPFEEYFYQPFCPKPNMTFRSVAPRQIIDQTAYDFDFGLPCKPISTIPPEPPVVVPTVDIILYSVYPLEQEFNRNPDTRSLYRQFRTLMNDGGPSSTNLPDNGYGNLCFEAPSDWPTGPGSDSRDYWEEPGTGYKHTRVLRNLTPVMVAGEPRYVFSLVIDCRVYKNWFKEQYGVHFGPYNIISPSPSFSYRRWQDGGPDLESGHYPWVVRVEAYSGGEITTNPTFNGTGENTHLFRAQGGTKRFEYEVVHYPQYLRNFTLGTTFRNINFPSFSFNWNNLAGLGPAGDPKTHDPNPIIRSPIMLANGTQTGYEDITNYLIPVPVT